MVLDNRQTDAETGTAKATAGALSDEALREAVGIAHGRVSDLESQAKAVATQLQTARQELALLQQLVSLRTGRSSAKSAAADGASPATRSTALPHPVVLEAIQELQDVGHPLHISELMDRLQTRNVEIPGAGAQANLIAHLTRSDEIVRPSRGMYALASWDLPDRPPVKKSRRRRVRGPSKRRS
jgi:hypothetical protein